MQKRLLFKKDMGDHEKRRRKQKEVSNKKRAAGGPDERKRLESILHGDLIA